MNENTELTEQEVSTFLLDKAKASGQVSPRVVIVNRTVEKSSYTMRRLVSFALITTTNNETLLNTLIQDCMDTYNNDVYFSGSNVNLQTDLEVDYLYFNAYVFKK